MLNHKICLVTILVAFGALLAGCDQQTLQDKQNQQNDSFTAARLAALQPASATYKGTIHLYDSGEDFQCILEVQTTSEFVQITQTQDPTETAEVPRLSGSMRFPALADISMEDLPSYAALTGPMGGFLKVVFDFGEYNPRDNKMVLPYVVPGYSASSLGELSGELVNGHYTGTWFSKPFGNVGTFDLTAEATTATTTPQGARHEH